MEVTPARTMPLGAPTGGAGLTRRPTPLPTQPGDDRLVDASVAKRQALRQNEELARTKVETKETQSAPSPERLLTPAEAEAFPTMTQIGKDKAIHAMLTRRREEAPHSAPTAAQQKLALQTQELDRRAAALWTERTKWLAPCATLVGAGVVAAFAAGSFEIGVMLIGSFVLTAGVTLIRGLWGAMAMVREGRNNVREARAADAMETPEARV